MVLLILAALVAVAALIAGSRTTPAVMKHLESFQAATGFMRHLATTVDAFQTTAVWLGADAYPKAPFRGSGIATTHQVTTGAPKTRPFGPRQSVLQGHAEESDGIISPAVVMGRGAGSGLVGQEGD